MPIYEYDCPECGRFEVIQKIDEKVLKLCPTCEEAGRKTKVVRAVSPAAFHLKGTGWYKTDYNGKSSGSTGTATEKSEPASKEVAKSDKVEKTDKPAAKACGRGCGCH